MQNTGKVIDVYGGYADVEFADDVKSLNATLLDVACGDEVAAHSGVLLQKRQAVDEDGEIIQEINNILFEIGEAAEIG